MNEPLSVRAAARDAPDAAALRVDGQTFTFREVAARVLERLAALEREAVRQRPYPLIADNTLAAVVTLYALLELRVPALLIHPRLTPMERDALLLQAAQAGAVAHEDAAVVIHTSGTTGEPRGAILTRGALLASAAASAANLGWHDDDCWFACMPIARVGGLSILTRSLIARRCVALAPGFDAASFPAQLDKSRSTLVSMVPTMLARVLDDHPAWRPGPQLRAVLVGGAAAPPVLLRRAVARGVPIVLTYGLTETCSQVVATPYDDRYAPVKDGNGLPLAGAKVRVVDGRIEVSGPMLMAGYWNGSPLAPGSWFDTGDLGFVDSRGCLQVHARREDLIVTGGENVYPAEVERVLEACPDVTAAAVFGQPDATWGQTVAALLIVQRRASEVEAELRAWVRERLAPHKRPRLVAFVDRLPQTAAGKLDRGALASFAGVLQPLEAPQREGRRTTAC